MYMVSLKTVKVFYTIRIIATLEVSFDTQHFVL